MKLNAINHLSFSVSNLEQSISFYETVFEAKLKAKGKKLAYFDLDGLWIALNEEEVDRSHQVRNFTHIAFSISEEDFDGTSKRLDELNIEMFAGRPRDVRDKRSIYFMDPDGHMFELHTGTLYERVDYYKSDRNDMQFYD